jgi:hypothetical protein
LSKEAIEELGEELKDGTIKADKDYIIRMINGKKYEARMDDKFPSCRWYVFIGFFSLIKTTNGRLHLT